MALVGINSITINAIDMASPRRFEPLCLFHTDKKTRNLVKLYCLYKLFFRAYSLILWREIVPNTPPKLFFQYSLIFARFNPGLQLHMLLANCHS